MGNIIKANITYWMTFMEMSHKEVASAMDMSSATLYNRMRLPSTFTIAELDLFAKKIGIQITDLVEKKYESK